MPPREEAHDHLDLSDTSPSCSGALNRCRGGVREKNGVNAEKCGSVQLERGVDGRKVEDKRRNDAEVETNLHKFGASTHILRNIVYRRWVAPAGDLNYGVPL